MVFKCNKCKDSFLKDEVIIKDNQMLCPNCDFILGTITESDYIGPDFEPGIHIQDEYKIGARKLKKFDIPQHAKKRSITDQNLYNEVMLLKLEIKYKIKKSFKRLEKAMNFLQNKNIDIKNLEDLKKFIQDETLL